MTSDEELQVLDGLKKLAVQHQCMVYVWTKHFGKSLVFARCSSSEIGSIIYTTFEQFYDEVNPNTVCLEVDISKCSTWEEAAVKVDLAGLNWKDEVSNV